MNTSAIIRSNSKSNSQHKIVIMGDGGVGKSCITIQLISNNFDEDYDPTIEDSYKHQCHVDGEVALLDILDTAGQEEFHAMKEQYMRGGDGFILVYSVTSRESFRAIPRLIEQIRRVHSENDPNLPLLIIGNKFDLDTHRQVSMMEGVGLAKQYGCDFFETSAAKRINIDQAFHQIVRRIRFNERRMAQNAKTLLERKNQSKLKRFFKWMTAKKSKPQSGGIPKSSSTNFSEIGAPGTYSILPWTLPVK